MPPSGWLNRQLQTVSEDVKSWPVWMRREAGLEDAVDVPDRATSAKQEKPVKQDRDDDCTR